MIYRINDTKIEVTNDIQEYDDIIFGRFSQFEILTKANAKNFLKFKSDKVEILINGVYKVLNGKIVKTDIYTIINNVIAYIINDKNNILIHGMVISKKGNGYLIIGDFGQGKTTLSQAVEKKSFEINSSDQTWLKICKGELYQVLGSMFYIKDGEKYSLQKEQVNKKIKIKYIIRILGVCDEGKLSYNINKNRYHDIKNLANYCSWHMIMPLFTDDIELFNSNLQIKQFLKNLYDKEVTFMDVRGDKNKIIEILGEI